MGSDSSNPLAIIGEDKVMMKEQSIQCIIGCNPDERDRLQELVVSVTAWVALRKSLIKNVPDFDILEKQKIRSVAEDWDRWAQAELKGTHNYATLAKISRRVCEEGKFFTIEALAECIAREVLTDCDASKVTVLIDKPEALRKKGARAAACEITRTREQIFFAGRPIISTPELETPPPPQQQPASSPARRTAPLPVMEPLQKFPHIAYIALGSNLGDRVKNLNTAVRLLACEETQLMATSFLYMSPPSYVTEQPMFANAVIKIATMLDPVALFHKVKKVEEQVGRQATYRWGPREVDLDIIFYDNVVMRHDDPELTIPHPRACERDFVLGPMCDINPDFVHPEKKAPVVTLLQALLRATQAPGCALDRAFPIPVGKGRLPLRMSGPEAKTAVMGILNFTPDSFSDGGQHNASAVAAVGRMKLLEAHGADILDVGGQSTRPNAELVGGDEEMARVVPVFEAAAQASISTTISVDTFRGDVARAAVEAGAGLINDVSGGLLDPSILDVAASLQAPICLMHYRGDPSTMKGFANYPAGVAETVEAELADRIALALRAGIYRWNIMVDPGIGFAKTATQSYQTLRNTRSLARIASPLPEGVAGMPAGGLGMLVGVSRKSFLGKVLHDDGPSSPARVWGTAAAVTASVEQGANVVRVHDVAEMLPVVSIADAIYRHTHELDR